MKNKQTPLNLPLTRAGFNNPNPSVPMGRLPLTREIYISGFTLFELLVSISIIAIMTALASVAYSGAQKKARDARRIQDLKAIQVAAEQYYSQSGYVYPTDYSAGISWIPTDGTVAVLENYPTDPKSDTYSCASGFDCNTNGYCICIKMDNPANANATNTCNFTTGTKTHFCVKNQQ